MRDARVSLLLAVATAWWGCAQGSADYDVVGVHHGVDSDELTPKVVISVHRDAGAGVPPDATVAYGPADDDDALDDGEVSQPAPEPPLPVTDASVPEPARDAEAPTPPSPGTATPCAAGTYAGAFQGELTVLNAVHTNVTGTLRFQLPSAEGARLALSGGTLEGKDADGNPLKATIAGSIACATGELVEGKITSGTYTRPDPVFPNIPVVARISGAIAASFSAGDRPTGRGTWALESELNTRSGTGSFEVQLEK